MSQMADGTPQSPGETSEGASAAGRAAAPKLALSLLALGLLTGAFLLGRRTAVQGGGTSAVRTDPAAPHDGSEPGGKSPAAGKSGSREDGEAREPGKPEGDVARFTSGALAEAGIQVRPLGYTSLRSYLQVTGAVEPNLAGFVRVTPRVAGKITSLRADVGDNVRAGQVLATMTSTELAQAQAAYRQTTSRVAVAWNNLQQQQKLARLGTFGRPSIEAARTQATTAQAEIDTARSEVDVARAGVTEAESEIRALQAALEQAQTEVKVTQARFNRGDLLLKAGIVSRQAWEQAQADYQHSQAGVEAAQANIAQGQARRDTAKANLEAARVKWAAARKRGQIAAQALAREEAIFKGGYGTRKEIVEAEAVWRQAQLDQRAAAENVRLLGGTSGGGNMLTVWAPLAGRVTERLVTQGETVTLGKPLFTVVNLQTVWVQLNVYQKDLPAVHVGQAVTVTADTAPGHTFTGIVSYIGDVVDETTRTAKVRAVIRNRGNVLRPQTFVRGRIAADVRGRVLTVPRNAVQTYEGKTVVFVQGDHAGEFTPKVVQVGETVDGQTAITSGLQAGKRVVTRGAFMVKAQAMKSELKDTD